MAKKINTFKVTLPTGQVQEFPITTDLKTIRKWLRRQGFSIKNATKVTEYSIEFEGTFPPTFQEDEKIQDFIAISQGEPTEEPTTKRPTDYRVTDFIPDFDSFVAELEISIGSKRANSVKALTDLINDFTVISPASFLNKNQWVVAVDSAVRNYLGLPLYQRKNQ